MLNSAAGVMLPSAIAPPMSTIRPGRDAALERERDVRQRADRDEQPVSGVTRSTRKSTACCSTGVAVAWRQHRAVEPALAVDVRGDVASSRTSGRSAPARDRHVRAAGELEHAERVVGRLLERLVAVDGRHAEQLDLGAREREQERDRVVVARVAVEETGDRSSSLRRRSSPGAIVIASISAAVGSDGCAPKREAAIAPAAQARRSASSRVAALEQRDEQAGGERVAGGRAVDGVDLRRLGARHLLPVLEQHRALGAERERDQAVAAARAPRARSG